MKVVISGYYGFDNIGDDAILLSIIQSLRKYNNLLEITVLSNNPEKTKAQYHVNAVNRWNLKDILQAIRNADGLISGGGSLLQDVTGKKSILYYSGIIKIAQLLKVPVFIYAQGMGPLTSRFSKRVVKYILQNTAITVRDRESKQLLESIGIKKGIEIVPDPVIGLKIVQKESAWWQEQSFSGRVLTVSVRSWPSSISFKELLAKALDYFEQEGTHIVFVPMHGSYDHEASIEVSRLMKGKSLIAPFNASIEEKISIIHQSDLLLGMRLHALIFAAITNTPFVALSYDPKVDSFATMTQQPIAGHVTEPNWDAESLYKQLYNAFHHLEDNKQRLSMMMEPLRIQAHATADKALLYLGSDPH